MAGSGTRTARDGDEVGATAGHIAPAPPQRPGDPARVDPGQETPGPATGLTGRFTPTPAPAWTGESGQIGDPETGLQRLADRLDSGRSDRPLIGAEIAAMAVTAPGQLCAALGDPHLGLVRAGRITGALSDGDLRRLVAALQPGLTDRDLQITDILWRALPERLMTAGLQPVTRWQFALLAADGHFARWGGVTGLIGTALAWLSQRAVPEREIAKAVLDHIDNLPKGEIAAATVQVATGLRAIVGPSTGYAATPKTGEATANFSNTAGLVLLNPYLPQLFRRLELTDGQNFRSGDAVETAFDLMHYLAAGNAPCTGAPRPLERIFCGIAPELPVRPAIPPEPDAKELMDGLLQAVLQQWSALGGTTVAGLRESFLMREGRLEDHGDSQKLIVSPRAFDMLLDRLPWSYGVIKFPWMPVPLHVNWRNRHG